MYQLFILGQLMDHPMSGYQIRKALAVIIGSDQTISFGALYPQLDKLAKVGDITLEFKTSSQQRTQKMATITSQGRKHFKELILAPIVLNKQTQSEFQMKINFLHLLTHSQQLSVLDDFEEYLKNKLNRLRKKQEELPSNKNMIIADIKDTMRVIDLRITRIDAQLHWIKNLILELNREEE